MSCVMSVSTLPSPVSLVFPEALQGLGSLCLSSKKASSAQNFPFRWTFPLQMWNNYHCPCVVSPKDVKDVYVLSFWDWELDWSPEKCLTLILARARKTKHSWTNSSDDIFGVFCNVGVKQGYDTIHSSALMGGAPSTVAPAKMSGELAMPPHSGIKADWRAKCS